MFSFGIIALALALLGFAVSGWLCVFQTDRVLAWRRRSYERSKFVQAYPFSSLVLKPWYRTYLRCAGIFIWLWAVGILYMVSVLHSRSSR